ncbi:hypothetical protein F4814DRAFT_415773 [Daldinia grandis]|nr:hypothetical protein F4814DRAFT_415773 [Daldinia grandis]
MGQVGRSVSQSGESIMMWICMGWRAVFLQRFCIYFFLLSSPNTAPGSLYSRSCRMMEMNRGVVIAICYELCCVKLCVLSFQGVLQLRV